MEMHSNQFPNVPGICTKRTGLWLAFLSARTSGGRPASSMYLPTQLDACQAHHSWIRAQHNTTKWGGRSQAHDSLFTSPMTAEPRLKNQTHVCKLRSYLFIHIGEDCGSFYVSWTAITMFEYAHCVG